MRARTSWRARLRATSDARAGDARRTPWTQTQPAETSPHWPPVKSERTAAVPPLRMPSPSPRSQAMPSPRASAAPARRMNTIATLTRRSTMPIEKSASPPTSTAQRGAGPRLPALGASKPRPHTVPVSTAGAQSSRTVSQADRAAKLLAAVEKRVHHSDVAVRLAHRALAPAGAPPISLVAVIFPATRRRAQLARRHVPRHDWPSADANPPARATPTGPCVCAPRLPLPEGHPKWARRATARTR
jgi:hypothetical protein